jgi:hypothetical protein
MKKINLIKLETLSTAEYPQEDKYPSGNIDMQNAIYLDYIDKRNKETSKPCYCGHTIECDCGNPSFEEFKHNLLNNNINERNLSN